MKQGNRKQKPSRALSVGLWIGTLLVLTALSTGCAAFGKRVIHPLEDDFKHVNAGDQITAKKSGAIVSDYWLTDVAGVEVEK